MKPQDKNIFNNKGQIMIVVILSLGGIMIGATIVGGILMSEQLRQIKNISDSAKAIYAADAGLNWTYYQFLGKNNASSPNLSNQANYTISCLDSLRQQVSCNSSSTTYIISKGVAGKVSRAFQISF